MLIGDEFLQGLGKFGAGRPVANLFAPGTDVQQDPVVLGIQKKSPPHDPHRLHRNLLKFRIVKHHLPGIGFMEN